MSALAYAEKEHFSALVSSKMGITCVFLFVVFNSCYHVVTIRLLAAEFVHVADSGRSAIFEVLVEDSGLVGCHAMPVRKLTNRYGLTYHARTQHLVACIRRLPLL